MLLEGGRCGFYFERGLLHAFGSGAGTEVVAAQFEVEAAAGEAEFAGGA